MPRPIVRLEITRPDAPARMVPIDHSPFTIGSAGGADLVLPDPSVAPLHAQVVLLAGVHHLLAASPSAALSLEGAAVPEGGIALAHGNRILLAAGCPWGLRFLVEGARASDREDRLVTLMEVARTITSSIALEDVLDRVLEGAIRFSGAERGYLFLRSDGRLVRWSRASSGEENVQVSLSVLEQVASTERGADLPGRGRR